MEDYSRTLAKLEARLALAGRTLAGAICCGCGRQVPVTAVTVLKDTRTPLTVVPGHVVDHRPEEPSHLGGPAAGAWLAAAVRQPGRVCTSCGGTMTRPGRDRFTRTVEADERHGDPAERGAGLRLAAAHPSGHLSLLKGSLMGPHSGPAGAEYCGRARHAWGLSAGDTLVSDHEEKIAYWHFIWWALGRA